MNKKGSAILTIIAILLFLALIFGALAYFGAFQSVTDKESKAKSCSDSTGILTVNSYNELNSTVIAPTITAGVNGGKVTTSVTSGTTKFAVGDKLVIFQSMGDYIDKSYEAEMKCGGLTLEAPMLYSSSDNPAIRIKNDDDTYVTDHYGDTGGTNQTNLDAGETLNMKIEFGGTSQESSGEGVYIVEFPAGSGANITNVELSGCTKATKPQMHSTLNAGSYVAVFNVPAVEGSNKDIHTLTVTLGATKDLMGNVSTDWYSKQYYIDTDGTIKFGVENSDGTAKYENTEDFDFVIQSA